MTVLQTVAVCLAISLTTVLSQRGRRGGSGNGGGGNGRNSPDSDDEQVITLSNTDFKNGTVVISQSNVRIELLEDIIFNPNSDYIDSTNEEGAYFCLPQDIDTFPGCDKTPGAFRLGFFAVISLEADNIIFDLNGFSISVSKEFLIQQRFFTLIGVGKGPFINGQGPTSFGRNINVENIEITNGHLGLTPHHGIHGNFIENIEIHDLTIDEFEVAGIQLNGFEDAYIHDVDIGPSLRSVPVVGRYSQARFGLLSFREMKERLEQLPLTQLERRNSIEFIDRPGESMTAVEIIERLILGMDLFFDYKINGNTPSMGTDNYDLFEEAFELFDNESGDPDGSALYGILLNSAGAAVNWFGFSTSDHSQSATIENVNIHDLNLRANEVIPYQTESGDHATGPYKGSLPMRLLLNLDDKNPLTFDLATDSLNNYNGNILSDAQIALAAFGRGGSERQRSTVDDEIIGWSKGENGLEKGRLLCNGDDMFHMDKGVIGIRIDRTDGVEMSNVNIRNINNWSELGSLFCNNYNDSNITDDFGTHPTTPRKDENSGSNYKYQGRVARGMSFTDVEGDINLENIEINEILSARGSAIGIDLLGSTSNDINLHGNVIIHDIVACSELSDNEAEYINSDDGFPNNNIISCALLNTNEFSSFDEDIENGIDLDIDDVEGPFVCIESFTPELPTTGTN